MISKAQKYINRGFGLAIQFIALLVIVFTVINVSTSLLTTPSYGTIILGLMSIAIGLWIVAIAVRIIIHTIQGFTTTNKSESK